MAENRILKGEKYLCIKDIKILGLKLFIKGQEYTSPYDNTLEGEDGSNFYITGRNVVVDYFEYFEKL